MIRTMYDTIGQNAAAIPRQDAQLVAGYAQGEFMWSEADWARFPGIPHVRIATLSADWRQASVADSELHALSPAQCRAFISMRNMFRPGTATVYRDWANLTQLLRGCAGLSYDLWLAWWTGHQPSPDDISRVRSVLPPEVRLVAWQYRSAGVYDVSAVLEDDWHAEAG